MMSRDGREDELAQFAVSIFTKLDAGRFQDSPCHADGGAKFYVGFHVASQPGDVVYNHGMGVVAVLL